MIYQQTEGATSDLNTSMIHGKRECLIFKSFSRGKQFIAILKDFAKLTHDWMSNSFY